MKPLKIWEPKEEPAEEPQYYLDMEVDGSSIDVVVRDEHGARRATIACVHTLAAGIERIRHVDSRLGFDLDSDGRVKDMTKAPPGAD